MKIIDLKMNSLQKIGGVDTSIEGRPELVNADGADAISFNGIDTAISIQINPLKDLKAFTAELLFKPASGGPFEQRCIHIGEISGPRMLFEIRLWEDGWALDSYVRSSNASCVLFDAEKRFAPDIWYHVAMVIDEGKMRHYVNGLLLQEKEFSFDGIEGDTTSIGARQNLVSFFKGSIKHFKVTDKGLEPSAFTQS
jgi:hypothetical protein